MVGTLFFGDNLDVLRNHIADHSVDLIYLDPPFNSDASYNVLFKAPDGKGSQSQITAFEDSWHWCQASEVALDEVVNSGRTEAANMLLAMKKLLRESDMMAYLAMMSVRLIELHRTLKDTGSIYLHCDPTASHYLKIIMDAIFSPGHYVNEIIWKRYGAHNDAGQGSKHFGRVHDTILFYSKSDRRHWTPLFRPLDEHYAAATYRLVDEATGERFTTTPLTGPGGAENGNPVFDWNGHIRAWRYNRHRMQALHDEGRLHYSRTGYARQKLYLKDSKGVPLQSIWTDVVSLSGAHRERLNFATQKPLALLERIVSASSRPGDMVLDPFCGCGTSVHAAHRLERRWIGIDITPLAVDLISRRLNAAFPGIALDVRGIPRDLDGARALWRRDTHLFQLWAVSLVDAQPYRDGKKGADGGIDGLVYFKPDGKVTRAAIVSVKGGSNVGVGQIRDLRGTIERLSEPMGIFVTLTPPTARMEKEAAAAGLYDTGHQKVPRLQILTVGQLLAGRKPRIPFGHSVTYKRAERDAGTGSQQDFDL